MSNPFPGWLAEVAADAVVVEPDDMMAEADGNLWSFSLTPEQAAAVTVDEVESFAAGVAEGRRSWHIAHHAGSMVFYWWHDLQAGQLRFSLVSASHGQLPFNCDVVPAESLATIVSAWLASPYLHGIPWSSLQPSSSKEPGTDLSNGRQPVWSRLIP